MVEADHFFFPGGRRGSRFLQLLKKEMMYI